MVGTILWSLTVHISKTTEINMILRRRSRLLLLVIAAWVIGMLLYIHNSSQEGQKLLDNVGREERDVSTYSFGVDLKMSWIYKSNHFRTSRWHTTMHTHCHTCKSLGQVHKFNRCSWDYSRSLGSVFVFMLWEGRGMNWGYQPIHINWMETLPTVWWWCTVLCSTMCT